MFQMHSVNFEDPDNAGKMYTIEVPFEDYTKIESGDNTKTFLRAKELAHRKPSIKLILDEKGTECCPPANKSQDSQSDFDNSHSESKEIQIPPKEPDLGQIPFQANLMIRANNTHYASFCGGSLIHPRWILTAAHCLEQNNVPYPARVVYVTLGSIYTNGTNGQKIQAEKLFLNKLYFESDGGYDIGLIKLKRNADLGKNVKPVKLHTNNSESLIGKSAYLTGYGIVNDFYKQPSRMRKALLHIDNPNKCLLDTRSGHPEICCSSNLAEGKACKGDSGGPLTIIDSSGKYIQVGITSRLSFLPICSVTINNSIYTRVSSYISWISTATGIDFRRYVPRPRS